MGGFTPKRQEFLIIKDKDFKWLTDKLWLCYRTSQLQEKSMMVYEQLLKLFGRRYMEEIGIFTVDKVTENIIRPYIIESLFASYLFLSCIFIDFVAFLL